MEIGEVERILSVVDAALREYFPNDYDARCMYAAFGIRDLLRAAGESAQIVYGDLLCFSVSSDGREAQLEGFGTSDTSRPSHFWVEAAGRRLDLGPYYLPRQSRLEAVQTPPVCWTISAPTPFYLRYRTHQRNHPDVELPPDDQLTERLSAFRATCARLSNTNPVPGWRWLLRSPGSVTAAARTGDRWAIGALKFLRTASLRQLPF